VKKNLLCGRQSWRCGSRSYRDRSRDEEDRKIREKELQLKSLEIERQRRRDELDQKRKESLAGQTRFFGDVLKHSLPKMVHDPGEFPAYFNTVKNLFTLYEVPNKLRSKLVIPMLNDKSKSLSARLSREKLDNYEEVRDYLLREFRLTPQQYRDRFYSGVKKPEETYTLFGSRLKTLLLYYLESRKAASKDDVIDLLVSDRILPSECLKHVLSTEF